MQSALPGILGPTKPEIPDLTGKVAVITGGALGIGLEIAKGLAQHNCRIIITNRKEEQADDAKDYLNKATNGKVDVEWVKCDLGNLKEVKEVFDGIAKKEKRLDFLALSAGINSNKFALDHDGIDRHFAVNWLGHWYAINRLWPLICKTASEGGQPRIIFESSEMHRLASKDTFFESKEEINDEKMGPVELYARTKLAMILGAKFGLAGGVIAGTGLDIYALSVHPGAVITEMQQQWDEAYPDWRGTLAKYSSLAFGRDVEQGSYSGLYALTSQEVVDNRWNGFYLGDVASPGKETEQASNPTIAKNLWTLSEKLVKEVLGDDALNPWVYKKD